MNPTNSSSLSESSSSIPKKFWNLIFNNSLITGQTPLLPLLGFTGGSKTSKQKRKQEQATKQKQIQAAAEAVAEHKINYRTTKEFLELKESRLLSNISMPKTDWNICEILIISHSCIGPFTDPKYSENEPFKIPDNIDIMYHNAPGLITIAPSELNKNKNLEDAYLFWKRDRSLTTLMCIGSENIHCRNFFIKPSSVEDYFQSRVIIFLSPPAGGIYAYEFYITEETNLSQIIYELSEKINIITNGNFWSMKLKVKLYGCGDIDETQTSVTKEMQGPSAYNIVTDKFNPKNISEALSRGVLVGKTVSEKYDKLFYEVSNLLKIKSTSEYLGDYLKPLRRRFFRLHHSKISYEKKCLELEKIKIILQNITAFPDRDDYPIDDYEKDIKLTPEEFYNKETEEVSPKPGGGNRKSRKSRKSRKNKKSIKSIKSRKSRKSRKTRNK